MQNLLNVHLTKFAEDEEFCLVKNNINGLENMVSKLKNTSIFRGNDYKHETNNCEFSTEVNFLNLFFSLASKGGGVTKVKLKIGKEDFQAIFNELVNNIPASKEAFLECTKTIAKINPEYESIFLECASIANKENIARLNKIEKKIAELEENLTVKN
jgi:hypothetical protein